MLSPTNQRTFRHVVVILKEEQQCSVLDFHFWPPLLLSFALTLVDLERPQRDGGTSSEQRDPAFMSHLFTTCFSFHTWYLSVCTFVLYLVPFICTHLLLLLLCISFSLYLVLYLIFAYPSCSLFSDLGFEHHQITNNQTVNHVSRIVIKGFVVTVILILRYIRLAGY